MKVLLTGGTGFVGSHVAPALLDAGMEVVALVRPGSENKISRDLAARPGFSTAIADPLRPATLEGVGEGCDAVVNLIGIVEDVPSAGITFERVHVEAVRNVVALARDLKVSKFVHMSALGAREMAMTAYHTTKYRGEGMVKASGLKWIVLRPGLIYGKGDMFTTRLKDFVRSYAPIPVFGSGPCGCDQAPLQPVAVEDVAAGIVKILQDENAAGRIYEFAGPRKVTLDDIVDMIARIKHADPVFKLPMPIWLMKPVATAARLFLPGFPFTADQLAMMEEGASTDQDKFFKDFGIAPRDFTDENLRRCF